MACLLMFFNRSILLLLFEDFTPKTHTGNIHLLRIVSMFGGFLMTIIPTGEVLLLPNEIFLI